MFARGVLMVLMLALAASLSAAKVEKAPPGMAKYLVVLWEPGTPIPGEKGKGYMKRVPEPDWDKLGGRLISKRVNERVVYLPHGIARKLRGNEAVAYFQRLWTGESLEDWDERNKLTGVEDSYDAMTGQPETGPEDVLQWQKSYSYDAEGNITDVGNDHYVYDGVGRLTQSTVNGKTETYRYDAFGNLIEKTMAGASPELIPVDPSSNRLTGVDYDAAGNVTSRAKQGEYGYDSLNMIAGYKATYPVPITRRILYDANDERIGTMTGSGLQRWTIRDFDGQIIREYTGSEHELGMIWAWKQDHIRGEGQLLAGESQQWQYSPTGFTYGGKRHYHLDHLGSVRAVTDDSGRSLSEHDYFPFGATQTKTYQEQINWGDPHIDGMRFAGHWRDFLGQLDVEGNDYLDYMHARYYDPNLGRFLSVDPVLGTPQRPQSWNRYSYVENNPVSAIDPTGMKMECITKDDGTEECTVTPDDPNPEPFPQPNPLPDSIISIQAAFTPGRDAADLKRIYADLYWRNVWNPEPTQIYNGDVMFGGAGAMRALGNSRINLLQNVTNPKLRGLIQRLYRPNAVVGTGSTADAIRFETQTGILLSKQGHTLKGMEMRRALTRVLRSESLSASEKQTVRALLIDLQNALSGL